MARSSCKNYRRSQKLSSGELALAVEILACTHPYRKTFKFFRKDGAFVCYPQLVPKCLIVCGAYHAGISKKVLCELFNLSRMDWQKIVDCFNRQPIKKQAQACMTASRTIAKYAQRPRRQIV